MRWSLRDVGYFLQVPQADTSKYITSFRLQNLQPYTVYDVQVRCKDEENNSGHWSDWSANATKRTPEAREYHKCPFNNMLL